MSHQRNPRIILEQALKGGKIWATNDIERTLKGYQVKEYMWKILKHFVSCWIVGDGYQKQEDIKVKRLQPTPGMSLELS